MPEVDDEHDLTRKQRREQAREQRKAAEEAVAASAARRARILQLGGIGAVVVAIIVVVVLVAGGGGSKKASAPTGAGHKGTPAESELVKKITALIGGIPEKGNVIGKPSAPVTLQYFGDLQCPICREFELGALPPLIEHYVRTGKLRIEYRNLETATREPETFRAQQAAALAAGKQNLMWYYLELFYNQQGQEDSGYVTEAFLRSLARQVPGLNLTAWLAARNDSQFGNAIVADAQAANNAGFNGTPSFLIGRTGGASKRLENFSLTDPAVFITAINSLSKA
jgi:protein-disulfide isomerase